jgi:hypothetical protein
MAIVEFQFREQTFFDILAAQVVRTPLPSNLLSMLPPGRLIERVQVGQVSFAAEDAIRVGTGELGFEVPVTVLHTSFDDAKAAGSLQPPLTQPVPCKVWIRLAAVAPDPEKERDTRLEFGE